MSSMRMKRNSREVLSKCEDVLAGPQNAQQGEVVFSHANKSDGSAVGNRRLKSVKHLRESLRNVYGAGEEVERAQPILSFLLGATESAFAQL